MTARPGRPSLFPPSGRSVSSASLELPSAPASPEPPDFRPSFMSMGFPGSGLVGRSGLGKREFVGRLRRSVVEKRRRQAGEDPQCPGFKGGRDVEGSRGVRPPEARRIARFPALWIHDFGPNQGHKRQPRGRILGTRAGKGQIGARLRGPSHRPIQVSRWSFRMVRVQLRSVAQVDRVQQLGRPSVGEAGQAAQVASL